MERGRRRRVHPTAPGGCRDHTCEREAVAQARCPSDDEVCVTAVTRSARTLCGRARLSMDAWDPPSRVQPRGSTRGFVTCAAKSRRSRRRPARSARHGLASGTRPWGTKSLVDDLRARRLVGILHLSQMSVVNLPSGDILSRWKPYHPGSVQCSARGDPARPGSAR